MSDTPVADEMERAWAAGERIAGTFFFERDVVLPARIVEGYRGAPPFQQGPHVLEPGEHFLST